MEKRNGLSRILRKIKSSPQRKCIRENIDSQRELQKVSAMLLEKGMELTEDAVAVLHPTTPISLGCYDFFVAGWAAGE